MRKKKLVALCLSVAIVLSIIAAPALVYADNNKGHVEVKCNINVKSGNKDKDLKLPPGKIKYNFIDTEDFLDSMSWATKAIERLGAKGVLKGYSDKSFKPQNKVTNLEALTMILQLVGGEEAISKNTKIHPALTRYQAQWGLKWGLSEVLANAVDEDILLESEIKGFNPNQPIKRHEFAKYLVRALNMTKEADANKNSKLSFKDAEAIPTVSKGFVWVANDEGLMTGDDKNQFKPNEPLTRAEVAVIIERAEKILDGSSGYSKGIVFELYDENRNILKIRRDGKSVSYTTVENVPVYKHYGKNVYKQIDIDDLRKGDILELDFAKFRSDLVTFIVVVDYVEEKKDIVTSKGILQSVSISSKRIKLNNTTYVIGDDTDIFVDNYKDAKLKDLEVGMDVTVKLEYGKVVEIDAKNVYEDFEGKIYAIKKDYDDDDDDDDDDEVESITISVKNVRKKFIINDDTKFYMLNSGAKPTDLQVGDKVKIYIVNGKVVEVEEIK